MRDHRKFERVSCRLRCWCEGEEVTVYARVGNLSEGGLFVRTHTPLDSGAVARLRLAFGDAPELCAQATVMWTRLEEGEGPAGMGLKFSSLSGEARTRLSELMSSEQTTSSLAT